MEQIVHAKSQRCSRLGLRGGMDKRVEELLRKEAGRIAYNICKMAEHRVAE
jgi:hypothetical protein